MSLSSISESSSDSSHAVVYSDGCCTRNGRAGAKAGVGVYWGPGNKRYTKPSKLKTRHVRRRSLSM